MTYNLKLSILNWLTYIKIMVELIILFFSLVFPIFPGSMISWDYQPSIVHQDLPISLNYSSQVPSFKINIFVLFMPNAFLCRVKSRLVHSSYSKPLYSNIKT
jgi:hypothetical protein